MLDRCRSERSAAELVARAVFVARNEQLTLLAAGVAFYGFLSLIPLVMLAIGIAVTLGGEQLAARVTAAGSDVLTPSAQELLATTVLDETGRRSATAIGSVGLLWGASRALRGLDRAFSAVYGTTRSKSVIDTVRDSVIAFVVITIGLAAVGALELFIQFAPYLRVAYLGDSFVVLGLAVTFLPLYVLFPGKPVGIVEALPGTILAAIGWFVLTRTFSQYASLAAEYTVYGALGAVFFVLVWMYASAVLLIVGAICNAVLAGREVDRQLQSPGVRQVPTGAMVDDATSADDEPTDDAGTSASADPESDAKTASTATARTRDRSDDPEALREEIERLRDRVDSFEKSVESRTVGRSSLESDLKRYVRHRIYKGHARDWGPYLVLLYGTAMTIGAFYFLEGGWAILAMFVVWTSTLGVFALMVLFGAGLSLLGVPGRVRNRVSDWRS
ncbi:YihY/virulence factor BrkB family protein [Natronobacterium gregoryi]|uniref:Membrane protein n=2 Tax=Natronobacterium gregoryi TaxID=44930 RepID=L0AJZ8_NATGS|nr:YihY/virulence factor BrkB family protein [Natronobacterium gregoryi]AFZ73512.1 putative membrane protein [Natronobacterium gregoryi SP2]ELY68368.1 ribonuclease BN [Natronobacterium gregoryi SP2]PLK20584.1 YihY/virulence factor BrkB family protein [Natronobacterium gregoryi SP2]SFJ16285.1 YihY family inner membrane protein [Natronobacterium gregoryi]